MFLFLLYRTLLSAQSGTITGKIASATDNSPISSATISVKGSNKGVSASSDDSFSISVPAGEVVLSVTFVGFTTKDVDVSPGDHDINISLAGESRQLEEVVVTALGITRQARTLVYATQTVKASDIEMAM